MDICDAFAEPGSAIDVVALPATHRLVATPESAALFASGADGLTLSEEDIVSEASEHEAWVAYGGRLRALSEHVGGILLMETFKNQLGDERHLVRHFGPEVEL